MHELIKHLKHIQDQELQELLKSIKHSERLSFFISASEKEFTDRLNLIEDFNGNVGFTVGDYCESPLAGFHPVATRMVLANDEYFLGCRANHFVLIFGYSEALWNDDHWDDCVVCLANHKGGLCIHVFEFKDTDVTTN